MRSNPLRLTPNVVRALAAGVVLNCVMYGGGIGGFVTQGLVTIIEYLEDPGTNLSAPLRKTSDNAMWFIRYKLTSL